MLPQPKVSVIVPNFNGEEYLRETLQSLVDQDFEEWECIIVDDGSEDNSIEIAQSFVDIDSRFYLTQRDREPKNANTCRNIGAENAKSDFLIFLDNDDLLLPFCLSSRVSQMGNGYDFLIRGTRELYSDGKQQLFGKLVNDEDYLGYFLRFEIPWQTTSATWKKSFFKSIQGFDENFLRLQDPEIHVRALSVDNLKIKYQYNIVDNVHRRNHQIANRQTRSWIEKVTNSYTQYFDKILSNQNDSIKIRNVRKGIAKAVANVSGLSKSSKQSNDYAISMLKHFAQKGTFPKNKIDSAVSYLQFENTLPKFPGSGRLNKFVLDFLLGN